MFNLKILIDLRGKTDLKTRNKVDDYFLDSHKYFKRYFDTYAVYTAKNPLGDFELRQLVKQIDSLIETLNLKHVYLIERIENAA